MTGFLARNQGSVWLMLAISAIAALHIVAFGNAFVADDGWFSKALDERTLWEFMAWRYERWSGRLPIEAVLVLIVNQLWVWKIFNSLMWLLLCYSAGRIALSSTGKSPATTTALAFVGLMLLSPNTLYTATWWITGSVNYLWPMALGLYGMLAYVDRVDRGNASRLACLLASGLAMYNEQVAIALLPASFIFLGIKVVQRRWMGWDIAQIVFMLANAMVVFTSPGSHQRFLSEQVLRFPDFALLDVFDKAAIGLELIFRGVVDQSNLMVLAALIASSALLVRAPISRLVKLMILAGLGFLTIGYVLVLPGLSETSLIRFYSLPPIDGASASSLTVYVLSAWSTFTVACLVAAAVAASWRSPGESLLVLMTLLLGLASLGALGFSPTAYASGDRINFVSQIAFLLVALRLTVAVEREYGSFALRVGIAVAALAAAYRVMQLLPI